MLPNALPTPRTTPLRGGPSLRWGILGPGRIARNWAATVLANTDQRIVAAGSASPERAAAFARELGIERAVDHRALVADPEVDAIYVASLNEQHVEHALLAIEAGKHVLVEKPIATTGADARRLAAAARAAGVYLAEAWWTRFLPQTDVILQLRDGGALGEIGLVSAEFARPFDREESARVFAPTLGGGALLDIGVYPLHWIRTILGPGAIVSVNGSITPEGIDARSVIMQSHTGGALSISAIALDLDGPESSIISGTRAAVHLPHTFFRAGSFDLIAGDERMTYTDPNGLRSHEGLCYEATAVAADIAAGLRESPLHPLGDSIAVLDLIDDVRRRIGAIAPAA